jgi:hypothetical protein
MAGELVQAGRPEVSAAAYLRSMARMFFHSWGLGLGMLVLAGAAGLQGADAPTKRGKLRQEVWVSMPGATLKALRTPQAGMRAPDKAAEIDGIEPPQNAGDNYLERLRGYLSVPASGEYTFWIAGNDQCELWLSTNEQKFYKRLIAWLPPSRPYDPFVTGFREWTKYPEQMSRPVRLEQGKKYFLEFLHKEGTGRDHVSVAWRAPGGEREVVPASALEIFTGDATDADDDGLPDTWEKGEGLLIAGDRWAHGEDGDPDEDGLTNRDEFFIGTHPLRADSDDDKVPDGEEVRVWGSNPLVTDIAPFTVEKRLPGSKANVARSDLERGNWVANEQRGTMTNHSVRGRLDFAVKAPTAGFYAVDLELTLQVASVEGPYPLRVMLDGVPIKAVAPDLVPEQPKVVRLMLPYLAAGEHRIQIQLDNPRFGRTLIVHALVLQKAQGQDADGDGQPDWAMRAARARNSLVRGEGQSLTSPAFVEGRGDVQWLATSEPLWTNSAPNASWFANVDLPEDGSAKTIDFSLENGVVKAARTFSWAATNVATSADLKIRAGDALRLTAFAGAEPGEGSMAIYLDGTLLAGSTERVPLVHRFEMPGVTKVRAVYVDAAGAEAERTISVETVGARFAGSPVALVNQWREWSNPGITREVHVDFDAGIVMREVRTLMPPLMGAGGLNFAYLPPDLQTRPVVARMSPGGPILAHAAMRAEEFFSSNDTMISETAAYPDCVQIDMRIAANNLQPDTEVRLEIFSTGAFFEKTGSAWHIIPASEFGGELGIAMIDFIQTREAKTSAWHFLRVFQGDVYIGDTSR